MRGFVEDMRNLFAGGDVLGLDIGTTSIKLVELARGKGSVNLAGYGLLETREYLDRPNAAIQTSALKISERETVELVKTIVREVNPKTRRVVVSIPAFLAFFAPLELPELTPAETAKAVAFAARQHIPLSPEAVALDWASIGTGENARGQAYQRVLLTGIPKTTVLAYQRIVKAAGLRLAALEVETQAVARVIRTDVPTLVVDIGGLAAQAFVVAKGAVHEVGESDYGGFTLSQALGRSLGLSPRRAEDLKRRRGLSSAPGERELSTSLYPFVDVILQECRRVRAAYERRGGTPVGSVTVVGGGGNLQGIDGYVSSRLGLPIAPFEIIGTRVSGDAGLTPIARSLDRTFSTALGLALRMFP